MADIELIIKIPEEDFERCKKRFQMRINTMGDAIANGTPLPKGHGKIVDADKAIASAYEVYSAFGTPCIITADQMYAIRQVLNSAKAIIEADKSEIETQDSVEHCNSEYDER